MLSKFISEYEMKRGIKYSRKRKKEKGKRKKEKFFILLL
jgi:hypothetical protein